MNYRPILLVEDNPMDLDLTRRAFSRRKLANPLLVARDGRQAVDMLENWKADDPPPVLILLDLKLPKLDGLEVLGRIKAHPRWKTIPVVALTTSRESEDVQRAYELAVNSYIVKPVDFDKFVEVVEQVDVYWLVTNHPPAAD